MTTNEEASLMTELEIVRDWVLTYPRGRDGLRPRRIRVRELYRQYQEDMERRQLAPLRIERWGQHMSWLGYRARNARLHGALVRVRDLSESPRPLPNDHGSTASVQRPRESCEHDGQRILYTPPPPTGNP